MKQEDITQNDSQNSPLAASQLDQPEEKPAKKPLIAPIVLWNLALFIPFTFILVNVIILSTHNNGDQLL
jgi:hypothetical protein